MGIFQYEYLSFYNTCEDADGIWVNNIVTNDLQLLDKDTLKTLKIVNLFWEDRDIRDFAYFQQTFLFDNEIFLIPAYSNGLLVIYNKKTEEIVYQKPEIHEKFSLTPEGIVWRDKLYLFPDDIDIPLLIYDFRKKKMEQDWNWNRMVRDCLGNDKKWKFLNIYSMYEDEVYIAVKNSPFVLKMNFNMSAMECMKINIDSGDICNLAVDHEYLWILLSNDFHLYKINKFTGRIEAKIKTKCKDTGKSIYYTKIVNSEDKIVLLPDSIVNMYSVNIYEKKQNRLIVLKQEAFPKGFQALKDFRAKYDCYWGYKLEKELLYLLPAGCNMMLELDLKSLEVNGRSTYEFIEDRTNYYYSKFNKGKLLEDDWFLSEYGMGFMKILFEECDKSRRDMAKSGIGKQIFQQLNTK